LVVENPVGTAPAFIMETEKHAVIALPGVPREMEYLMQNAVLPYLRNRYQLTAIIKTRVLHSAGVGESQIDDLIGDLETLSNPTIGLAAHSGQVDIRITAKANSEADVYSLIQPIEAEIRNRLGAGIYGADEETLEKIALDAIQKRGWSLAVVEAGLSGDLLRRLASAAQNQTSLFRGGEVIADLPTPQELQEFVISYRTNKQVDICLGVAVYPGLEKRDVHIFLITPEEQQQFTRPYGGPPEYAPSWALNHSLDFLRKI
jgi:nicotinamide-nucleotide amidase